MAQGLTMSSLQPQQDHHVKSDEVKCLRHNEEVQVLTLCSWSSLDTKAGLPETLPKQKFCTEILGSESTVFDSTPGDSVTVVESSSEGPKVRSRRNKRKSAPSQFPPPLTTLGGADRLRLSTKRENGRLLLTPYKPCILEAERSDGRLRLRLLPSKSSNIRQQEVVKALVPPIANGADYRRSAGKCKEEEVVGPMGRVVSSALWVSIS